MVEITVIIEGGVVNTDTVDVLTVDNSQALGESINRIFRILLDADVRIIIQPSAGYRNAAVQFIEKSKQKTFLYVDLDDRKENIPNWFTKLETENPNRPIKIPETKRQNVFFMIQEMEAWILKQPASIDRWGVANDYLRLPPTDIIADHSLIAGKNIEEIEKPTKVLKNLIKHFFWKKDNGKKKKLQYGKLKSAPGILDQLDVHQLLENDSELQRFCKSVVTSKS